MDVVGWGSPVGLGVFMLMASAAIFLVCLAVRMVGGRFDK
jgi:hypothetical protein